MIYLQFAEKVEECIRELKGRDQRDYMEECTKDNAGIKREIKYGERSELVIDDTRKVLAVNSKLTPAGERVKTIIEKISTSNYMPSENLDLIQILTELGIVSEKK